jgi:transmembrane sensor
MEATKINTLISKYLSGNASLAETEELNSWRKEAANAQLFEELENIWKLSILGKETTVSNTEQAWEKFKTAARQADNKRQSIRKKYIYTLVAAAAAVPLIVFLSLHQSSSKLNIDSGLQSEVTTESLADSAKIFAEKPSHNFYVREIITKDTVREFYLPDSTKIWLNKHSKFTYPEEFLAQERAVNLEGEAFFEVKHNENRPFIIYTESSITKGESGTAFNVKAYPNKEVELSVISGTVAFTSLDKHVPTTVVLKPSTKNSSGDNKAVNAKNKKYAGEYAWKKGAKSPKKFRKFLNKIKGMFKKQEKDQPKEK